MPDETDNGLMVRVALLEARVRLIALALKGTVAVIAGAIVTHFMKMW